MAKTIHSYLNAITEVIFLDRLIRMTEAGLEANQVTEVSFAAGLDQKDFEKVHKNLAGTDFDFQSAFDDNFRASPGPKEVPTSLKGIKGAHQEGPQLNAGGQEGRQL